MYQLNQQRVVTNTFQRNRVLNPVPNDGFRMTQINPSNQPIRRGSPMQNPQMYNSPAGYMGSGAIVNAQSPFVKTHNNNNSGFNGQGNLTKSSAFINSPAPKMAMTPRNNYQGGQNLNNNNSGFNGQGNLSTTGAIINSPAPKMAMTSRNNYQGGQNLNNNNSGFNGQGNLTTSSAFINPPAPKMAMTSRNTYQGGQNLNNNNSGFNGQGNLTTSSALINSPAPKMAMTSRNNYQGGQNLNDSFKSNTSNASAASTGMMPMPRPKITTPMPRNYNTQISGLLPIMGTYSNRGMQNVTRMAPATMNSSGGRKKYRKFGERENEKLCILTGSVERVIKYGKIFQNHFCYYQVFGSVVAITDGSIRFEKKMLLRDRRGGPVLQLTYYCNSTYINIVDFDIGQDLRAVGRMIGPNNMSALSIRAAKEGELDNLLRMSYISDYAVHYYCGENQHPKTENK